MDQGMTNSEACRIVGINRRTGTRWRYGRTVTSPTGRTHEYATIPELMPSPTDTPSRYLTEAERIVIADGIRTGMTQKAIAIQLGRSRATISRELARNRDPQTGAYTPWAAHRRAAGRRPRPKPRKLATAETLRHQVAVMLDLRFSPEQISNRLKLDFPDQPGMRIAPETIYQTLYDQAEDGLSRILATRLRTGRAHRRPHRRADARITRRAAMTPIDDRPEEADDRLVPGHWEGDLIVGAHNRSAIGTVVERTSRYTMLIHMDGRATAADFANSLVKAFADLPEPLKRSLTWDQGTELACHDDFEAASGVPVFFCEPRSPWQRGTNENTNGLLRQYFPKATDLTIHSTERLAAVAAELNNRPRKVLGWQTPAEHLATIRHQPNLVATTP